MKRRMSLSCQGERSGAITPRLQQIQSHRRSALLCLLGRGTSSSAVLVSINYWKVRQASKSRKEKSFTETNSSVCRLMSWSCDVEELIHAGEFEVLDNSIQTVAGRVVCVKEHIVKVAETRNFNMKAKCLLGWGADILCGSAATV